MSVNLCVFLCHSLKDRMWFTNKNTVFCLFYIFWNCIVSETHIMQTQDQAQHLHISVNNPNLPHFYKPQMLSSLKWWRAPSFLIIPKLHLSTDFKWHAERHDERLKRWTSVQAKFKRSVHRTIWSHEDLKNRKWVEIEGERGERGACQKVVIRSHSTQGREG